MNLLLQKPKPAPVNLDEIHRYAQDLETITQLRNKCINTDEKERYNGIIKVMQLVMVQLHKTGGLNG